MKKLNNRLGSSISAPSILVTLLFVFGSLLPFYQWRVERAESAERIAALQRDIASQSQQIEAVADSDPEADEVADIIELSRQSFLEAEAAIKGVTDRTFELISGYCTRFARQVVEATHGKKYAAYFKADAVKTANAFLKSPWGYHWPRDKEKLGGVIQVGDLLFKRTGSGGFGHVGVYVGDIKGIGKNLVAENSSVTAGRIQGAKGYRPLEQFNADGKVDVIVRLPLPENFQAPAPVAKAPRLITAIENLGKVKYSEVKNATLSDGRWRADSATLMATIGRKAATSQRVVVVDYLKANNATPYKYGQHLGDKSDPRTYLFIPSN